MNNINYVDLVVFIILLFEIIKGIKSGVIVPFFDIIGVIVGWFVAKSTSVNFAPLLDKWFAITPFFRNKIAPIVKLPDIVANLPATPQNVNAAFSSLHLPNFVQSFLMQNATATNQIIVQQYIINSIANSILYGIAFIALFLLIIIVFRIVGVLVRKAVRVSPFLKWVDALLGALFRFSVAFIILFVIAEIIVTSMGYLKIGGSFLTQVETSRFYHIGSIVFPILKKKAIEIIAPMLG
jgi:hypothetical protein